MKKVKGKTYTISFTDISNVDSTTDSTDYVGVPSDFEANENVISVQLTFNGYS